MAAEKTPRSVEVEVALLDSPIKIDRRDVLLIREQWRVLDRWWTPVPVIRHYFDCLVSLGASSWDKMVVFREGDLWFRVEE